MLKITSNTVILKDLIQKLKTLIYSSYLLLNPENNSYT